MKPSKLHHHLDSLRVYLRAKPVLKAELFGLSARGEWGPDMSVELLVTPAPGASKMEMFTMEGELENLLGRRVHILLRSALEAMKHGPARDLILGSTVPVYPSPDGDGAASSSTD